MRKSVADALDLYQLKHDGARVTSPGKFEGSPVWLPAVWDAALESRADDELQLDYWTSVFTLDEEIADVTGEPVNHERHLLLWETDYGFVQYAFVSSARLAKLQEDTE